MNFFLKVIELFARQIVRDIKSTATITEHNFHLLIGNNCYNTTIIVYIYKMIRSTDEGQQMEY